MSIPRAWCPNCRQEIPPAQVLLGMCPHCGAVLDQVLCDRRELEATEKGGNA